MYKYHCRAVIENVKSYSVCLGFVCTLFLKGESIKNERPPSNSSQTNHKVDTPQEERQNKTETLDQNMASCNDQCKREDIPEEKDKATTKQDIPVAFAIPAHEVSFVRHHSTSCHYLGKYHKRNKTVMNYTFIDCLWLDSF